MCFAVLPLQTAEPCNTGGVLQDSILSISLLPEGESPAAFSWRSFVVVLRRLAFIKVSEYG
jgi:hypothetical protein